MKPLKILFANIPFDGHFNPLTGLATHLKDKGHDVRWYTQETYQPKLANLGIPHYPFRKAVQLNQYNLDQMFAGRLKHKGQIGRLNFDLQHVFILRAPEFFEDIREVQQSFDFDVLIADVMFTALPLVKEKLNKPVIGIGVLPLVETSRDLAPAGLGMTPTTSFFGKLKQNALRYLTDVILFGKSHRLYLQMLAQYGISAKGNMMDYLVRSSTLFLQSGTPGFEYKRSDLGSNVRFIGALLPVSRRKETHDLTAKARWFRKVILVTQGTIEKDPQKLIVPTLEAFKNTEDLVVVTTGGSMTQELRDQYPYNNVVIEDFIPFEQVLPLTDVYVTNGGYGGVMLSIEHGVPMVAAGVHEGKNEINARIGYFKLGVNLNTEAPTVQMIKAAVQHVLTDGSYRQRVQRLGQEFRTYNALTLAESHVYTATDYKPSTTKQPQLLEN